MQIFVYIHIHKRNHRCIGDMKEVKHSMETPVTDECGLKGERGKEMVG